MPSAANREMRSLIGLSTVVALTISPASSIGQCVEWQENETGFVYPILCNDLAYDTIRGRSVLWGSYLGTDDFFTMEYDGTRWSIADSGNLPLQRYDASLAFDGTLGRTVMFGGVLVQGNLYYYPSDTWGWDGVEWDLIATEGPRGRAESSLAFDPARGVTVLHGGVYRDQATNTDVYLRDTWELVDGVWELRQDTAGPLGSRVQMAFHPGLGGILAFGAQTSGTFERSTWLWDGVQWTRLAIGGPNDITSDCDMVYQEQLGRMFLIANHIFQSVDLWEWTGSEWTLVQQHTPELRYVRSAYHAATDAIVVVPEIYAINSQQHGNDRTWEYKTTYPPMIDAQPQDQEVSAGSDAVFSVEVSGDITGWQWFKDQEPVIDDDRISGAGTSALHISGVRSSDAGSYWVVVSGGCGQTESHEAQLIVVCEADFNDDGIVDTLDMLLYLNAWSAGSASADFNGDGTVNTLDFLAYLNAWAGGC